MIELQAVEKSFAGHPVLRGFSYVVPRGERVALLGLSGAGKTTVLRLICGLERADRGTVRVDGDLVAAASLSRIRRKIGLVVQEGGLFPHLSGRRNLEIVGRDAGMEEEALRRRIAELTETVRLPAALLERRPAEWSGGQRQRVSLMRALLLDPPILLLDEALRALDPITRDELQGELEALFARLNKTVLLVTHDLRVAARLAREQVLCHEGRVEQAGSFRELSENPVSDFARRFFSAQAGIK